jgi:ribosomal protein L44E
MKKYHLREGSDRIEVQNLLASENVEFANGERWKRRRRRKVGSSLREIRLHVGSETTTNMALKEECENKKLEKRGEMRGGYESGKKKEVLVLAEDKRI